MAMDDSINSKRALAITTLLGALPRSIAIAKKEDNINTGLSWIHAGLLYMVRPDDRPRKKHKLDEKGAGNALRGTPGVPASPLPLIYAQHAVDGARMGSPEAPGPAGRSGECGPAAAWFVLGSTSQGKPENTARRRVLFAEALPASPNLKAAAMSSRCAPENRGRGPCAFLRACVHIDPFDRCVRGSKFVPVHLNLNSAPPPIILSNADFHAAIQEYDTDPAPQHVHDDRPTAAAMFCSSRWWWETFSA
ncbi:hypothetical protein GGX14DRAFT_558853 [Mycena pura]|uniref:Uncharacterized protein n=1 Tax=Mycena pura TaxID=153505 RepID=A0AAD6VVN7_9AGAR|nr:hypothetical protein GGX14DRAFT_558853 [Mycena pura]